MMIKYISSHITSLKYIYSLIKHNEDNPPKIKFSDEYYEGPNKQDIPLRIFHPKKTKKLSVIIFPGASPLAENHPAMINLASIIANLGYKVFVPRIDPLKNLDIKDTNIEWFANAYEKIVNRGDIDSSRVAITGISFGGSLLLSSISDDRMQSPAPKSAMIYGAAFDLNVGFKFLLNGEITHNDETVRIKPNEWGVSVILHNFLSKVDVGFDTSQIREVLNYRMKDDMDKVEEFMLTLNNHDKEFMQAVLDVEYTDQIKNIIFQIMEERQEEINKFSPQNISHKIKNKIFIMHGANDSMVPFTESVQMHKNIKDSELLISYLYEHREISNNRGIFFKLYELIKMERFFAAYFRYNES